MNIPPGYDPVKVRAHLTPEEHAESQRLFEVWFAELEKRFDPAQLFVFGTQLQTFLISWGEPGSPCREAFTNFVAYADASCLRALAAYDAGEAYLKAATSE